MAMHDLPKDAIVHVLSMLEVRDIRSAALSCRRMRVSGSGRSSAIRRR